MNYDFSCCTLGWRWKEVIVLIITKLGNFDSGNCRYIRWNEGIQQEFVIVFFFFCTV